MKVQSQFQINCFFLNILLLQLTHLLIIISQKVGGTEIEEAVVLVGSHNLNYLKLPSTLDGFSILNR